MVPILLRLPLLTLLLGSFAAITGCNKPTSGQNTSEYRDGQSGATPKTVTEDTRLDSTKEKQDGK